MLSDTAASTSPAACQASNNPSINMTRDLMMCCLMEYVGKLDQLKEYDTVLPDLATQTMKIYVTKNIVSEEPVDTVIIIEGVKVMTGLDIKSACCMLVGLTHAVDLDNPKDHI